MAKKQTEKTIALKDIEKMLDKQTTVILSAVDERINSFEKKSEGRLSITEINIIFAVDKKLQKMELRINQKIEKLTITLDKFLKRLTDMEDEFAIMKMDINRLKKVIQEKLGVDL